LLGVVVDAYREGFFSWKKKTPRSSAAAIDDLVQVAGMLTFLRQARSGTTQRKYFSADLRCRFHAIV